MHSLDEALVAARRAVSQASVVCRGVQRNLERVRSMTKDDRSPVTVADFASQAVVSHRLRQALGPVRLVAEESAAALRQPDHATHLKQVLDAVRVVWPEADAHDVLDAIDEGRDDGTSKSFWTLDPVDGTKGFLRGEQYAISLAWIDHGRVALGALACPNLSADFSRSFDDPDERGVIYSAYEGAGVYEHPADSPEGRGTLQTPLEPAPGQPVRVCESVESGHSKHEATAAVMARLGGRSVPLRLDSQCKYAVVARGQADLYLRMPTKKGYREKIWDHAAGALIATEAGRPVSDIRGKGLDFGHGRSLEKNLGVVCAAPRLHGMIIEAIRGAGLDVEPA